MLSYLGLRGRCRNCRASISWRYPAIELLTGGLFYYTAEAGNLSVQTAFKLVFICFLITLAFIDIDTYRLPDVLVIPLWIVGIIQAIFFPDRVDWLSSVLGMVAAGGSFWLIAKFYPRGMGFGDVKFVAALGAFLGFPQVLLAIFLASLAGSVIGSITLWLKGRGFKQHIPFGPYLALGGLISLYWGEKIIRAFWP